MTQLSRERLEQYAFDDRMCNVNDEIREMARGLLAAEAQKPVRYLNKFTGVCVTLEQQPDAATDTAVYVPLFDAPQPVAVPDELVELLISAIEKEQERLFGEDYLMDTKDCVDVIREESQRVNARRAAAQPSSGGLQLVGEVVARNHPNHERNVDFRWLDFKVDPGTKLYAIKQERSLFQPPAVLINTRVQPG